MIAFKWYRGVSQIIEPWSFFGASKPAKKIKKTGFFSKGFVVEKNPEVHIIRGEKSNFLFPIAPWFSGKWQKYEM